MAVHNNVNIKCGLVNIQSVRNKTYDLRDLINNECLDLLAVTETWMGDYELAVIHEMTPDTHTFLHVTRHNVRGGGVGVFLSKAFKKIKKCTVEQQETYELLQVECELNNNKITLIIVYRPPYSSKSSFIDELKTYLDSIDMVGADIIVCGDFNIWMDDLGARYVPEFVDMMDSFNLVNMVGEPTTIGGHTIDLVFANKDIDLVKDVKVEEIFSISPVHKLIFFKVQLTIERKQKKMIKFRSKKNFNSELLLDTIYNGISYGRVAACPHGAESKEKCLTCLDDLFNSVAKERYEEMCPIIEKEIVIVDSAPWYNEVVDRAKKAKEKEGTAVA